MTKKEIIYELLMIADMFDEYCPCCGEEECTNDCTYSEDDPAGYEIMQFNREKAERVRRLRPLIESL